ncbi:unnamed protein product, partial [Trichobilharzia regenti]
SAKVDPPNNDNNNNNNSNNNGPNKRYIRGRLNPTIDPSSSSSSSTKKDDDDMKILTEEHCVKVPHVFHDRVLKLCSLYNSSSPSSSGLPFHFFNRLLHDSGMQYAYWPVYNETVKRNGDVDEDEDEDKANGGGEGEQQEELTHEVISLEKHDALLTKSVNCNSTNTTN